MMRHRVAADDRALPAVELASCLAGAPLRRRNYLRLLTAVEGDRAANVSTGQSSPVTVRGQDDASRAAVR